MIPALFVRDLTVRAHLDHETRTLIDAVSFDLARGEILGLVGESGSGKSLLCRALVRLLPSSRLRIEGGAVVHQHTVRAKGLLEGEIAVALGELAKVRPEVNFGSYPWTRPTVGLAALKRDVDMGVNLVARSRDADALAAAVDALAEIVRAHGKKPEIDPKD